MSDPDEDEDEAEEIKAHNEWYESLTKEELEAIKLQGDLMAKAMEAWVAKHQPFEARPEFLYKSLLKQKRSGR